MPRIRNFALQGNEFPGVAKVLAEKYRLGSLHPTPNGFQELATRVDAGQPNVTLKITYDDSTVVLIGTSDENADNFFVLNYIGQEFINRGIRKAAKDDLCATPGAEKRGRHALEYFVTSLLDCPDESRVVPDPMQNHSIEIWRNEACTGRRRSCGSLEAMVFLAMIVLVIDCRRA